MWWGRHEATLKAPGTPGRVCGPSNSYQKLIISAVLGTKPSISLLFPTSPLQVHHGKTRQCIAHLPSSETVHLLQTAFPGLLCQIELRGSSGRRLEGGRSQDIHPTASTPELSA